MKRNLGALAAAPAAIFLTLAAGLSAAASPKIQGGKRMTRIAHAANAFGIGLLGELTRGAPDANCFVSPYSVQQALLLAGNGAAGSTRTQIETALRLDNLPLPEINVGAKALRESLISADPKVTINVANALWADRSAKFDPKYQETCRAFYDATTQTVALRQPSGAAQINDWVARKTENKITSIVTPAALRHSIAVLTNAVYFHGTWTTPFLPSDTRPLDFHTTASKTIQVPTMIRTGSIDHAKTDGWEAVALPYGGGRLRLYAVLPPERGGLSAFLGSLTQERWSALTAQLQPTRLSLYMPRVHVDYAASLKPALIGLGMPQAFREDADFEPTGLRPMAMISDVLHKTTLDVDEAGTTASAATAVIMRPRSMMGPPPVIVRIDRPFFCVIQDEQTGLMLFAGAIQKPG